jgi:Transposase DDE domain
MKNSGNLGFDQHYNAQIAVDQKTLLVVSNSLSNHPNDQLDALPTIDAINPRVGSAKRVALDAGYFSVSNIEGLQARKIDPYIATGRQTHDSYGKTQMAQLSEAPAENATPKLKMRYKLKTEEGKAFYRLRKCTVEPVIGIIKEAMGFRQFSLRGSLKADGEWNLVCLAFNFRRLHVLMGQKIISPTGC